MELQTWTRKANALKAVQEAVNKIDESTENGIWVTGYEAADIGNGIKEEWAVKVFVDLTPAEAAEIQEQLGEKAQVVGEREEEANDADRPAPSLAEPPEEVKQKMVSHTKQPRTPQDAEISVIGGKNAANPYREGTKSYEAFKLLQDNPGMTRAEFVKAGGRTRTLTHGLKVGQLRTI